jgi:hypothetical protein
MIPEISGEPAVVSDQVKSRLKPAPLESIAPPGSTEQAFADTFPQSAWVDPITHKRKGFRNLNPSAQHAALAGMGFNRDSALIITKPLVFRAYARESLSHLERKIHDSNALNRAKTRLYQRLKTMAQNIDLSTGAADVDLDEWHEN